MSFLQSIVRMLMPDERRFFDHVVAIAETSVLAAQRLHQLAGTQGREAQLALVDQLKDAEHQGDAALRGLTSALDETYVTPIDREDLYHLGSALETISDLVNATASHLHIHHMETLPEGSKELADLLLKATDQCLQAVKLLRAGAPAEEIRAACKHLDALEYEADQRFRTRLGALFETQRDAITLIKHKEFLEGLENTIDHCAHVSSVVEAILIKNS